jgi:hypothetical protein
MSLTLFRPRGGDPAIVSVSTDKQIRIVYDFLGSTPKADYVIEQFNLDMNSPVKLKNLLNEDINWPRIDKLLEADGAENFFTKNYFLFLYAVNCEQANFLEEYLPMSQGGLVKSNKPACMTCHSACDFVPRLVPCNRPTCERGEGGKGSGSTSGTGSNSYSNGNSGSGGSGKYCRYCTVTMVDKCPDHLQLSDGSEEIRACRRCVDHSKGTLLRRAIEGGEAECVRAIVKSFNQLLGTAGGMEQDLFYHPYARLDKDILLLLADCYPKDFEEFISELRILPCLPATLPKSYKYVFEEASRDLNMSRVVEGRDTLVPVSDRDWGWLSFRCGGGVVVVVVVVVGGVVVVVVVVVIIVVVV